MIIPEQRPDDPPAPLVVSSPVTPPAPEATPAAARPGATEADGHGWPRYRPHGLAVGVALAGLGLAAAAVIGAQASYDRNEQRLLTAETKLAADSLAVAPVDIQRRLGRATSLAAVTGDAAQFRDAISSSVPKPFAGVVLFKLTDGSPSVAFSAGVSPLLGVHSPVVTALLRRAGTDDKLVVARYVTPSAQRLGYAMGVDSAGGTYIGYAEQVLPADRLVPLPPNSPVGDSDFAIYMGDTPSRASLLEADTRQIPLPGSPGTATFALGDRTLTLQLSPRQALLGWFPQALPWFVGLAGVLATLAVAWLTERLIRRRAYAEQLAAQTARLYRAERSVAETLQHSLLPQDLPATPALALATRYLPGTEGIEVGGDWYDVIDLGADRVFFTVGDVSGRGLAAATIMSTLRNAITAYAVEGHSPGDVLAKLDAVMPRHADGRFATVLCGVADLAAGTVTLASAGHPPPLLVRNDGATRIDLPPGPPIGVGGAYPMTTVTVAADTALLAYTDGLVERRGETITDGLDRLTGLARLAPTAYRPLETLLDSVLAELVGGEQADDIALLALQRRHPATPIAAAEGTRKGNLR